MFLPPVICKILRKKVKKIQPTFSGLYRFAFRPTKLPVSFSISVAFQFIRSRQFYSSAMLSLSVSSAFVSII